MRPLQEHEIVEILGRSPIATDLNSARELVSGRTVVVTGAAGSVGSELCRQIVTFRPSKLICIDHNETGLFELELELRSSEISCYVSDFTDHRRLRYLLENLGVHIIFHAAAYKHVPLMEENPYEVVRNNILGLYDFLEVAEEVGCAAFVFISSDKAVNPCNLVGVTKRIGELMLACREGKSMRCVSVRFGNVLGSRGSVTEVFRKQIAKGGPVPVTHPDVSRYFMTVNEAVSLVLQAAAIGEHGDILLLDPGVPVRIRELANKLIRFWRESSDEIEILFTGLRRGEKLHEDQHDTEESLYATSSGYIKGIKSKKLAASILRAHIESLRTSMMAGSDEEICPILKSIVPHFHHR